MSEISKLSVYRSVDIIRHRLASLMYIDQLTLNVIEMRDLTRWLRTHVCTYFLNVNIQINIIFFSLLDSDWLKSVPINP